MDIEDKILNRINSKDLPEEMRYLAEYIGLDNVKLLMKVSGGSRVSIPLPSSFKMIAIERHIRSYHSKIDFLAIKKISQRV